MSKKSRCCKHLLLCLCFHPCGRHCSVHHFPTKIIEMKKKKRRRRCQQKNNDDNLGFEIIKCSQCRPSSPLLFKEFGKYFRVARQQQLLEIKAGAAAGNLCMCVSELRKKHIAISSYSTTSDFKANDNPKCLV